MRSLFFLSLFFLSTRGSLSTAALATWVIVLVLYVSSIVGGRLYTGMHGFLDVFVGIILGITGWVLQRMVMPEVERGSPTAVGAVRPLCPAKHPYPYISSQLL